MGLQTLLELTYGFLKSPYLSDGAVLVNGLNPGAIQLWDVTTGNQIAALDGHTQGVETLKFSPDGKTLVSTAMDGTILLWDWNEALADSSKSE